MVSADLMDAEHIIEIESIASEKFMNQPESLARAFEVTDRQARAALRREMQHRWGTNVSGRKFGVSETVTNVVCDGDECKMSEIYPDGSPFEDEKHTHRFVRWEETEL